MVYDKYLCGNCIEEDFLQSYINSFGIEGRCEYCGEKLTVCEFESIVEMIIDGIEFLYDDPANGLGYIDGEYVISNEEIYDTYDLLFDVFGMGGSKSFNDILKSLPDQLWCKKEFYGLDAAEEMIYTWEHFVNLVKYKNRYFFINEKSGKHMDLPYIRPYEILDEFKESAERLGLIDILKKDANIYRARKNKFGTEYMTPEELGTPKAQNCIRSNRMSPAGIPMFYGSLTEVTCLVELGNEKGVYTVGKWKIKEDLKILNLTKHFSYNIKSNRYY